jgi:hypothetical protein
MRVTLTRKALYDRVWAEPVDTFAKEYGLSNVGLGKACRRHDIPVPSDRWGGIVDNYYCQ